MTTKETTEADAAHAQLLARRTLCVCSAAKLDMQPRLAHVPTVVVAAFVLLLRRSALPQLM